MKLTTPKVQGFCFLEHCRSWHEVGNKVASYTQFFNIVVAYIPNGYGYDIFIPAKSVREVMDTIKESQDEAEAERLNDLAMKEFDRRYPPSETESDVDSDYDYQGELHGIAEDFARSEEDGWYYADD